jgi:hypothetical protein
MVDDTGVHTECAAGSGYERSHVMPPIFGHPGWWGRDVHVPLSAGGSQGPVSNAVEFGRTVPEPPRERSVPSSRRGEVGQPPSRWSVGGWLPSRSGPSDQPLSRARQTGRYNESASVPACKLLLLLICKTRIKFQSASVWISYALLHLGDIPRFL